MFARFAERGLSLPASDFFKGLTGYYDIVYLNLNPNGIFHTAVFVHFHEAFLGIKPHWILFRKFFRVKPQPSARNPRAVLQDDLKKFVSELPPPPQEVEIPEEGKTKAKERREVGEGDDTIVVEDTSDEDDDEETLQDRFQLRSRFSRPGLPHVPLVQDPPASLEASLAAPLRRPRNASRKCVAKKLKVTETAPQEVSRLH
jgi:hypothetical protein